MQFEVIVSLPLKGTVLILYSGTSFSDPVEIQRSSLWVALRKKDKNCFPLQSSI